MQESTGGTVAIIIIGVLVLLAVIGWIEAIPVLFWNRYYYTHGLRLRVIRIPVGAFHTNLPPASRLEASFPSGWTTGLVFRQVAPDTYGFRGRFFDFSPVHSGVP